MSANARLLIFAFGALLLAGGTVMTIPTHGGGIGMMIFGALVIASLGLERRYGRPGAPTDVPLHHFELTKEKFVDQETGQRIESDVRERKGTDFKAGPQDNPARQGAKDKALSQS